jgi:hypothetical protein
MNDAITNGTDFRLLILNVVQADGIVCCILHGNQIAEVLEITLFNCSMAIINQTPQSLALMLFLQSTVCKENVFFKRTFSGL